MLPRFFSSDIDIEGASARLGPDEAHHLTRVMRLAGGDLVTVFDGHGHEWRARVQRASRETATLALLESIPAIVPAVAMTVVQGVLKHESMEDVVRDCTMAGIAAFQPVMTARTTVKFKSVSSGPERWRRIALSSAKQCGLARLPEIHEVTRFDQWLPAALPDHSYFLVEPGATPPDVITVRQLAGDPVPEHATLLIGPEGGWTPEERDAALAAGARPLSLGPLTLRANAVALAASAALIAIWR